MRKLLLLACISAAFLAAQDLPPSSVPSTSAPTDELAPGPYHIVGVKPPTIIRKVEPQYSREARLVRLQGTVLLNVIIVPSGRATDFKILKSVGLGLDESAIAAVGQWQFRPGTKDGQPVNVLAKIEVNFRMLDKDSKPRWGVTRANFLTADGTIRPVIDKVVAPHVARDATVATATANFDVNEKGEPVNITITGTSEAKWGGDTADALKKWKFIPGAQNGRPVTVACTMEFNRGY
ncbi:MAG TPA: TonB family protein [Bryobacteraceae bacterium]|nr:TonB family protein [Bryobacteraceae bacterium]